MGGGWPTRPTNRGDHEVFVQPYPGAGGGRPVSSGGGNSPAWSRDGTELFFTTLPTADGVIKMMSVPVSASPTFTPGTPSSPLRGSISTATPCIRQYDVSRDGTRFLMVRPIDRPAVKVTQMILVQNWFEELKRLVPTK